MLQLGKSQRLSWCGMLKLQYPSGSTLILTDSLPNTLGNRTFFFFPSAVILAFPGFLAISKKMLARIVAHFALKCL